MITVVPDTSCFSLMGHSPRLWGQDDLPKYWGKSTPIWGDYLSLLKEWNVSLKGTCYHSEPLKTAHFGAPLMANLSHIHAEDQTYLDTEWWQWGSLLMNNDLWLCNVLYNLHICQIKCSALQWTWTEGSRFKSPGKGFPAWKCSTSETLSHTSVYLCLLLWLQFTLLLSCPPRLCLFRSHPILAQVWP